MLISFDFHKAFDSVEHEVLFEVMHKFGFPEDFTQMIKALFLGIESCTTNNGYSSKYIKVTQGLRQGCPISSMCFIILAEVLAIKIRQNKSIVGIKLAGKSQKKQGQFADDLWVMIQANQENYSNLINTVQEYCKATGLSINYNKIQVMHIGALRNANVKYYSDKPLHWSEKIKILGITISADRNEMVNLNFQQLVQKMMVVLNKWHARTLTLLGRVLVVNTLGASLTTQKFTCLLTPNREFFQTTKKLITNLYGKISRHE